ncbi:MAG: HD domain-containing protein [Phycisphaerae bacterium]
MEKAQLKKIEAWFDSYVAGFYCDGDDFLNSNIELKEKHSRLVRDDILWLADRLKLTENQKNIAAAIGLLHDVGRFSQFRDYRTYRDTNSLNHSLLGRDVLRKENVLAGLDSEEINYIETAVAHHGDKEIPAGLEGDTLLYCQLIRDADKIDIYRVVLDYYKSYLANPESFKLELELPDEPTCSEEIIRDLLAEKRISYDILKSFNDIKLLMLSWVYDVNFAPTFERIKQQKFLEKVIDFLPQTEDITRVRKHILDYVDKRISQQH